MGRWEENEGRARNELVMGQGENEEEKRRRGGREIGNTFLGDSAR